MKAILAAVLFSMLCGCGGSKDAEKAEFKGTWKHTAENTIGGTQSEETVHVIAKGPRFRLSTQDSSSEIIETFDGQTLSRKAVYASFGQEEPGEPNVSSEPATADQTYNKRFWAKVLTQGQSKPGGSICGRDTVFYLGGEKRPDGEIRQQAWMDAQTGVMLKLILSVYSSQAESQVMQETWECQSIDFSPVDESAFAKP